MDGPLKDFLSYHHYANNRLILQINFLSNHYYVNNLQGQFEQVKLTTRLFSPIRPEVSWRRLIREEVSKRWHQGFESVLQSRGGGHQFGNLFLKNEQFKHFYVNCSEHINESQVATLYIVLYFWRLYLVRLWWFKIEMHIKKLFYKWIFFQYRKLQ